MSNLVDLCDEKPAAVSADATVADAIRVMLEERVGGAVVLDSGGQVAGIFTERDVLQKLALSGKDPEKLPVRELMTTAVELATPHTTPGEALHHMMESHIRHLPIVAPDGKLLGLLSLRNLLQWKVDELIQQLDSMEQYVTNDSPGG